jgi:hypothetical protein
MKLNKKSLMLLFLSLLFVFPFVGKEKPQAANAKCLSCHTEVSICGEKNRIEKNMFSDSVHGHLLCIDCHEILLTEDEGGALHKDSFSNVNCIAECHQEESQIKRGQSPLNYPDSIHGKAYLEKGLQDAAKCWDCHGKHNIKSPSDLNSRVNRRNISLICSVCHGNFDIIFKYHTHCKKSSLEYMEGVHGKALYKAGLVNLAAACTDCHGVHNIKGV